MDGEHPQKLTVAPALRIPWEKQVKIDLPLPKNAKAPI
jgi:hypothetical protein